MDMTLCSLHHIIVIVIVSGWWHDQVRGWHKDGCTGVGRPDGVRRRKNGCMRWCRWTARERVREWARWHDRARGHYETARRVGGPNGADGVSWDKTAGVGCRANRLGRCISVNRFGGY